MGYKKFFEVSTESGYKSISYDEFEDTYYYEGELGAIYTKMETKFVLWAPTAEDVKVILYGTDGKEYRNSYRSKIDMIKGEKGIWQVKVDGDLNGEYYNYLVKNKGIVNEVVDPYAKALGVNGDRGMVVDLLSTNPEGWENDKKPKQMSPVDAVIYEMHIRDFSIDENSGVSNEKKGKFLGVCESGTTTNKGTKTCLDHLEELGVTHIHLLPSFDYSTVDEANLDTPQYNWGYDPKNYNAPEGSYSTDPFNGKVRIKEFKEMVKKVHEKGIRVVMDMVYNHTMKSSDSNLNLAVPDYYYRQDSKGNFSDGSACGNETASERKMVRKFIVDSVIYWAKEYHIDGFRFDLMGLHDIETMKEIRKELDKIDKTILMYGEGWNGGPSPLPEEKAALKKNTVKYGNLQIAAFSDDIRDGVKGHVFYEDKPGFVNGAKNMEETIKFAVVASTKHPEVNYNKINYSDKPWANEPYQTVTYASAHDNYTLFDKLQVVNKDANISDLKRMNKLIASIILTSQGIAFIHAGEEFARTKVKEDGTLEENSYKSPDSVNKLDWKRKEEFIDIFNYYKGLIKLRKTHKGFRMDRNIDIANNIRFLSKGESFSKDNIVAYTINSAAVGDTWSEILVIFNSNNEEVQVKLPSKGWSLVVDDNMAGVEEIKFIDDTKIIVPKVSAYILHK